MIGYDHRVLVVIDTNVIVSALRSRSGASNEVIRRLALGDYDAAVTTAMILEYEAVLRRPGTVPGFSSDDLDTFIDSFCALARETHIYFRWRPFLPDPEDDIVFECAVASGATHIITHNVKDFPDLERFGISVMTPGQFLHILQT